MLREVKPRNARTARIVKAREAQLIESRKKTLFLHGAKCPEATSNVLKTFSTLTKPYSITLNKKNKDIHPFEDASSLEFLAQKNECGTVVFASHSKKRPNTITILRTYDNKTLDMVELLLLSVPRSATNLEAGSTSKLQIGLQMKPLLLFAGSQWDDPSSTSTSTLYRTLKSMFLDLFSGEEVSSIDVAGLQYFLQIATGELPATTIADSENRAVIHLRWYKIRTLRSNSSKVPRVELDEFGPTFDFRLGRFKEADENITKEALKRARAPNEARTKKNIEMDIVGDKIGKVHLGRQDLGQLQTRKMKGLKRVRDDDHDSEILLNGRVDASEDIDMDSENGGVEIEETSTTGGSGAESEQDSVEGLEFVDEDEDEVVDDDGNDLPKRQKLG